VIPVRRLYGDAFAVDESIVEGYAHGRPYDLEGYGRPVRLRLMHDMLAIQRQLAPPRH
jgi:hypothetical protein